MNQFTIRVSHDGNSFTGLVFPKMDGKTIYYTVQLENEKHEQLFEIVATPPATGKDYWAFKGPEEMELPEHYDKQLLDKISEAIDKTDKDIDT